MKEQFQSANAYIQRQEYDKARRILTNIDHPKAKEWLNTLDSIEPAKMRHEVLWDSNPTARRLMILVMIIFGVVIAYGLAAIFQHFYYL